MFDVWEMGAEYWLVCQGFLALAFVWCFSLFVRQILSNNRAFARCGGELLLLPSITPPSCGGRESGVAAALFFRYSTETSYLAPFFII